MYNIQVHVPYEKQQYKKKKESLYSYLRLIPSLPVPTAAPNWHTCTHARAHTHTHTHTHTNKKQVAVGMYKSEGLAEEMGF